jgi:CHASE3 domain sensor protein
MTVLVIIALIFGVIGTLLAICSLIVVWRFNKYIQNTIEDKLEETLDKVEELHKALQIAIKEGLLDKNGKIRKPYVQ